MDPGLRDHKRFTMDGYQDLDGITRDLWDNGFEFGFKTPEQLKVAVAFVVSELVGRLDPNLQHKHAALELFDACHGIVGAAEADELI